MEARRHKAAKVDSFQQSQWPAETRQERYRRSATVARKSPTCAPNVASNTSCFETAALSRFAHGPSLAHEAAMLRCMKFVVGTAEKGLILNPSTRWDGSKDFEFTIRGRSDSTFASDPVTRKSTSGYRCLLNEAPYIQKSATQKFVTTSVTEAEIVAGCDCIQGMLFGMNLLESLQLKVKKPMLLEMDNKGGVDLLNSWSISGNTRAIAVRLAYLRELREQGIIEVKWISTDENEADLLTKNLDGTKFAEHRSEICGG